MHCALTSSSRVPEKFLQATASCLDSDYGVMYSLYLAEFLRSFSRKIQIIAVSTHSTGRSSGAFPGGESKSRLYVEVDIQRLSSRLLWLAINDSDPD